MSRLPRLAMLAPLMLVLPGSAGAAGQFVDLGVQITSSTIQGTTFGRDPSGREVAYTVMRGEPAKLIVLDLRSGEILRRLPLPGAAGAWNACTASDGTVYIGTDGNGHLYRYLPGEETVHDLGRVLPEETFVWDVVPGRDGEVFGGTYPGCRVFRYHPDDGFSDVGRGPLVAGENYVRAVAYDAGTGRIYAGVGSHAHLIELDPATGRTTDLLPGEYAEHEFVYGLDAINGRLFAYVTRLGKSLVFDLKSRRVEAVLPKMSGQQVITHSPDDGRVYYTIDDHLTVFDPAAPQQPPVSVMRCGSALGFTWLRFEGEPDFPGWTLVAFTRGAVVRYNPATGKSSSTSFTLPAEPTGIQSIELGPDGRIWTGGYLSGGHAAYDPATGRSEQFRGLSQSEDMTVVGASIYFGIYPGARLSVYDTRRAWDPKSGNPRQFGNLGPQNQSRPMAMLGVPELNRVFVGTIPEYGQLGGVLAVYDIAADRLDVHEGVVPNQSISSLTYARGLIVGGSSIWGGLGQKPSAKHAELFVWDPRQAPEGKVYQAVPVPGASAITGLFAGPDGNVWGMAGATLFIFDPAARELILQKRLFEFDYGGGHVWRDAFFVLHPSGQIYGTMRGRLFRLDPQTREVTVLRERGAGLLAMDRDGRLYFREGAHLWQYTP